MGSATCQSRVAEPISSEKAQVVDDALLAGQFDWNDRKVQNGN